MKQLPVVPSFYWQGDAYSQAFLYGRDRELPLARERFGIGKGRAIGFNKRPWSLRPG
jgi:hypothetical protein